MDSKDERAPLKEEFFWLRNDSCTIVVYMLCRSVDIWGETYGVGLTT